MNYETGCSDDSRRFICDVHGRVLPNDSAVTWLKEIQALAGAAKAKHKLSSFHEHSNTCGGCHFWSGYESAIADLIQGVTNAKLPKGAL